MMAHAQAMSYTTTDASNVAAKHSIHTPASDAGDAVPSGRFCAGSCSLYLTGNSSRRAGEQPAVPL